MNWRARLMVMLNLARVRPEISQLAVDSPEIEAGERALERGRRRHHAVQSRADRATERAFHLAEVAARK